MPSVQYPVDVLPARWDWPSAIGNFMLQCGTVEYFVGVFLKDRLQDDEFEKVKRWHLKDRLSRIEQYMNDERYPVEERAAFEDLVRRLAPMRELRNHLAHGHLHGRLNVETEELRMSVFKASDLDTEDLEDARHVEFPELLAALGTISGLLKELEKLAGFVMEDGFRNLTEGLKREASRVP